MVVGFTTTCANSAYHHWLCEFEPRSWQGVLDTILCDKVCQWLATGRWFSLGTPVSSTNKTDRHGITEILLKVALNTINETQTFMLKNIYWYVVLVPLLEVGKDVSTENSIYGKHYNCVLHLLFINNLSSYSCLCVLHGFRKFTSRKLFKKSFRTFPFGNIRHKSSQWRPLQVSPRARALLVIP